MDGVPCTVPALCREEELMEEDEVYGADTYQQPRLKDEVVSKSSFAMRSEDRLQRRKAEEQGEDAVDEAEDGGVQFLAPEGKASSFGLAGRVLPRGCWIPTGALAYIA